MPPGFRQEKILRFRVAREGKTLTVWLGKEVAASKDLKSPGELGEFDTVQVGLSGEAAFAGLLAKVYSLKVAAMPR